LPSAKFVNDKAVDALELHGFVFEGISLEVRAYGDPGTLLKPYFKPTNQHLRFMHIVVP